ncbi:MAG: DDE-type integrase/transposase/recombinase [Spirochaetes bacterium]|nr:DDE-type integrase/transposase/recombinase [Spirochaetota bacterium]
MRNTVRRTYHTDVKIAAYAGCLPVDLIKDIPKSTLHGFRSRDHSACIGAEYSQVLAYASVLREIASCKAALIAATAIIRVAHLVRSLGVAFDSVSLIKVPEWKSKVVALVQHVSGALARDRILAILGLSRSRFSSWAKRDADCRSSPLSLCRRSYPNQLTAKEFKTIKTEFSDPVFAHWPLSSIAWGLIHSGRLSANVATILRYAKLLGLGGLHGVSKKSRKRGSVDARRLNQAWHLDVTVVTTSNNLKAYVQILLDSFSRRIIAWEASANVSGIRTTELLRTAFSRLAEAPMECVSLIVDGGSENNNRHVEAYLATVPVKKLIARVDVSFSNSMIEAVNKILKYRYLFRKPIPDLEHLHVAVESAIMDYNSRPHYALRGLTPDEAYRGKVFDEAEYRQRIELARQHRLLANRSEPHPCLAWDDTVLENYEPLAIEKTS